MNKWTTDSTLVRAIDSVHVLDKRVADLDTSRLNKSLTTNPKLRMSMDCFDGVNESGLCRVSHCGRFFCHLTSKGNSKVSCPPATTENEWVAKIESAQESIFGAQRQQASAVSSAAAAATTTVSGDAETPTNEREAVANVGPAPERLRLVSPPGSGSSNQIATQSFWESPEAMKLFEPKESDNTVEETLKRRVKALAGAVAAADGWRNVVEGRDPDDLCSDSDVKAVQQRCMLLCQAHLIALKRLG